MQDRGCRFEGIAIGDALHATKRKSRVWKINAHVYNVGPTSSNHYIAAPNERGKKATATMYITRVHLKDVRCFEDAELDLSGYKLGTSVLIAGNNGTGKSAIVRAIAMGLCDRDSAAALLRELSGSFVKSKDDKEESNEAIITVELCDPGAKLGEQKFIVETKITEYPEIIGETVQQKIVIPHLNNRVIRIPEGLEKVIQECKNPKSRAVNKKSVAKFIPWINTFVTGYGSGLRTSGTAKFSEYFAPDALYSIFNYSSPLQDPETAWRRLVDASRKDPNNKNEKDAEKAANATSEKISKLIHGILALHQDEVVVLENNGIFVKNRKGGGELIELDAKGDGHKSLTKVLLDILVWYLLFENYDENKQGDKRTWRPLEIVDKNGSISVPDVCGIVIIDEIEQHLHPTLQRQIIKSLSEKLPGVQFIMSTHSPLCISGTCDVREHDSKGYKIYSVFKEGDSGRIQEKKLPVGLRADQILVDYFELTTTLNVVLQKKIDRLRALFAKATLNGAEKKEYEALDLELRAEAPLLAEREDDRRMEMKRDAITEELRQMLIKQGVLKDDSAKKRT